MRADTEDLPEGAVRVNQDTRLDNRVLDLRVPAHLAIFRIQSGVTNLFREFLCAHDFTEIHSPKMIGGASEGGANVFSINYFGDKAFLAQSPQLYKQMSIMADFKRVFEIGAVFRAENSNTYRHLTEFTGLDLEMEFKESYSEVLDVLDELLYFIVTGINERYKRELEVIQTQYPHEPFVYKKPALRLKFPEAVKMLQEAGVDQPALEDLSTATEKFLGKLVKAKYGTDFYILEKYPSAARPFYTMPCPEDSNYSNSYDLFFRGEEICSGAQRIHDPELLARRAKDLGVDPSSLSAYIDSFKYGAFPHGGAGIGLERVVMLFLGLGNIRKTSLFPRDPSRLTP
jgi:aspartyl-tRNA synthetase